MAKLGKSRIHPAFKRVRLDPADLPDEFKQFLAGTWGQVKTNTEKAP